MFPPIPSPTCSRANEPDIPVETTARCTPAGRLFVVATAIPFT